MRQPYLLLGTIVKPQGVRGEVKVRHEVDDPARFLELESVYCKQGSEYSPLTIEAARVNGDDVFLTIEGVNDRDEAEKLRGTALYIDRAHARELDDDEVFIADILGAKAVDTEGKLVGTLKDVLQNGGADVLVFDTPRGGMMMPFLKRVVTEIDADEGRIVLDAQALTEVAFYENSDSDDLS